MKRQKPGSFQTYGGSSWYHSHVETYHGRRRRYGFLRFLFDGTMTVFTGGLWLIWIFVREMRGR